MTKLLTCIMICIFAALTVFQLLERNFFWVTADAALTGFWVWLYKRGN